MLLLYFGVGPILAGLGVDASPWLFRWHMFHSFGRDACDVSWWARQPDGTDAPVDRYALLGLGDWRTVPIGVRKLTRSTIAPTARKMCRALGRGADLRVDARCGTVSRGWEPHAAREQNLCAR